MYNGWRVPERAGIKLRDAPAVRPGLRAARSEAATLAMGHRVAGQSVGRRGRSQLSKRVRFASFCIQTRRRCIQSSMRPNLTGVWNLIRGDSDFGFLPPPQLRVDVIAHEDPQLRIRTRQKDANGDVTTGRCLTIGDEAARIIIRDRARWVRACWDAAVLVVETSSEVSGKSRRIEDRWTLDAAGDWLTIDRLHEQPGGPVRQRLRLQRLKDPAECISVTNSSDVAGRIKTRTDFLPNLAKSRSGIIPVRPGPSPAVNACELSLTLASA